LLAVSCFSGEYTEEAPSSCSRHNFVFLEKERKMKILILAVSVFCLLVIPASTFAEVVGATNETVAAIAEPILDNILEAFEQNDYVKYSRDFDDTLKESISDKKFVEVDRYFEGSLGNYQDREYLGFLVKGQMSVVLWKARYDKSEDDVLIKLVLSKRADKYLVTGLWFQ